MVLLLAPRDLAHSMLARIGRKHILATPLENKELGYLKTDLIYSLYYHGEAVKS